MSDTIPEPTNQQKLDAIVTLATSIVAGKPVRLPIEEQLRALAETVLYLTDERP